MHAPNALPFSLSLTLEQVMKEALQGALCSCREVFGEWGLQEFPLQETLCETAAGQVWQGAYGLVEFCGDIGPELNALQPVVTNFFLSPLHTFSISVLR